MHIFTTKYIQALVLYCFFKFTLLFSWFHFKLCLDNQRIFAWIEKLVAERIGFVMFLLDEITLCIFGMVSFQTSLVKPEDACMYKTGCSKTIGFAMLLWHETTLCIFEVVPFQTLLITLLGCCTYTKLCSKTIGVVMFLWNETILCIFEVVSFSKFAYKT